MGGTLAAPLHKWHFQWPCVLESNYINICFQRLIITPVAVSQIHLRYVDYLLNNTMYPCQCSSQWQLHCHTSTTRCFVKDGQAKQAIANTKSTHGPTIFWSIFGHPKGWNWPSNGACLPQPVNSKKNSGKATDPAIGCAQGAVMVSFFCCFYLASCVCVIWVLGGALYIYMYDDDLDW